jgi:2-oxoglutarate ferredoxin oxidoreductase subunit alpha
MDNQLLQEIDRPQPGPARKRAVRLEEHIVEIVSDSGEGAQKCGQSFGSIAARMGNGVWTVEIIPAEIQPPARSIAGTSGNRVRVASQPVTNGGDEADLVVAFNEQVLLSRRTQARQHRPTGGQVAQRLRPADRRVLHRSL